MSQTLILTPLPSVRQEAWHEAPRTSNLTLKVKLTETFQTGLKLLPPHCCLALDRLWCLHNSGFSSPNWAYNVKLPAVAQHSPCL